MIGDTVRSSNLPFQKSMIPDSIAVLTLWSVLECFLVPSLWW